MAKCKEISVVVPAYNEEERLPERMAEILDYLKKNKYDYEIILVDDGSSDKTVKLMEKLVKKDKKIIVLKNSINRGKGYSVKKGMLAARKKLILFTDADKSTPMKELAKLERYSSKNDVVIASRGLKESDVKIKQARYKVLLGTAGNKLIQVLAAPGIKDTQCGFKLFNKKAQAVFKKQTIDRFGFDFEVLFIARKKGLNIKEVPVTWINDERSKVKFKDYFKTLSELLKIRLNNFRGKYG